MKTRIVLGLSALGAVAVTAAELTLTSLDQHGQLTWTNAVSNATYRVEWASAANGPWQSFDALTNLARLRASNTTVTVAVPMFYRVVWTDAPPQPGLFAYQGFSAQDVLLVTGRLDLRWVTNVVSGTWAFDYVGPGDPTTAEGDIGPQIGAGELEGSRHGNTLSINLNKGWCDNNVFLDGLYEGNSVTGRWCWSTFSGARTVGPFIANRISP